MGFETNAIKLLTLAQKRKGVNFERPIMIGRQTMNLNVHELDKNLRMFGMVKTEDELKNLIFRNDTFAEPFLELLGAKQVHAMDYSDFEKANILHDLNKPIPDHLRGAYSVVLEFGTLEHIFNFPAAIKNVMELAGLGGHVIMCTPNNNQSGHGFYQFSPELLFNVFSPANGFKVKFMAIAEENVEGIFLVKNPADVRSRVLSRGLWPSYLMMIAERVELKPIFDEVPQQSDYATIWDVMEGVPEAAKRFTNPFVNQPPPTPPSALRKFVKGLLPKSVTEGIAARRVMNSPERYPAAHFTHVSWPQA